MTETKLDPQVRSRITELIPVLQAHMATARQRLKERFGGVAAKVMPSAKQHKVFVEEAGRLFEFFSTTAPYTENTYLGLHQLQVALQSYLENDHPDLAPLNEVKEWEMFILYEEKFARTYRPGWSRKKAY